jgi:hypothetical protein
MKMTTLAVLVGSLALGAQLTGCASSKAAERQDAPIESEAGDHADHGAEEAPEE